MTYSVNQLAIYPVKSAAGILLEQVELDHRGPLLDRVWMVVDSKNRFVSQRNAPKMCLIRTVLQDKVLCLSAPNMPEIHLALEPLVTESIFRNVLVWKDSVNAIDCGDEAASWLSGYLNRDCRLVFMPKSSERLVDKEYAKQQQTVGFADGFPLLVISEASLEQFNTDLAKQGSSVKVDLHRFRPNIVIAGCEAFAEDNWNKIQINNIVLSLVKPCSRCIIPALDQDSGVKQMEVIEVLNKTRRRERKTYFGQNALHDGPGIIKLHDVVTVLE